jgi:hypothetical protein
LGRSFGLSSLMSRNTGGNVWVPEDALKKPCTEAWWYKGHLISFRISS